MSSKKHRKKLKQQYYNVKNYNLSRDTENKLVHDMDTVYHYLKEKSNTYVNSDDIIKNCDLYFTNRTQISTIINHVIKCYNVVIVTKSGRNGGYMYYE